MKSKWKNELPHRPFYASFHLRKNANLSVANVHALVYPSPPSLLSPYSSLDFSFYCVVTKFGLLFSSCHHPQQPRRGVKNDVQGTANSRDFSIPTNRNIPLFPNRYKTTPPARGDLALMGISVAIVYLNDRGMSCRFV